MKVWTDTVLTLAATDQLTITSHDGVVSLHLPSSLSDGGGFTVSFLPEHLSVISHLYGALKLCVALYT